MALRPPKRCDRCSHYHQGRFEICTRCDPERYRAGGGSRAQEMTAARRRYLVAMAKIQSARLYPATLREIGGEIGVSSTNGFHWQVNCLVRDGYALRCDGRARGYVLTEKGWLAAGYGDGIDHIACSSGAVLRQVWWRGCNGRG